MANFMKLAVNEQRKFRGEEPLTAAEFLKLMREKSAVVELDSKLTSRAVNEGFRAVRRRRTRFSRWRCSIRSWPFWTRPIRDSTSTPCASRRHGRYETAYARKTATVVITHYQRLLDIVPDVVHVLYRGRIIHTGDKTLALKLEKRGLRLAD